MRKLIKLAVIALGIRALLRWRKSRHEPPPSASAVGSADPADQLRRKLAESREDDGPHEAASVSDRRAEVHGQGRAALDEMTSTDES